ncbi:hypothetical protein [Mesorhizobium sp. LNJC405B00]|uniref:hypothetical protein n=1 Tax=Mesorhizobium sp. LNJC405B00 TaxID=1287281 RepID=UPI000B20D833|nr:hypothetical protein [Mesorhizobium sp. LNJC405B00]
MKDPQTDWFRMARGNATAKAGMAEQNTALKRARSEKLARLVATLDGATSPPSLDKDIQVINGLQDVIDAAPKPWAVDFWWTFATAAVCVALLWWLSNSRLAEAEIRGTIDTSDVLAVSGGTWAPGSNLSLATKGAVVIRGASGIDFRGFDPSISVAAAVPEIDVSAPGINISLPQLVGGDTISISCPDNTQVELGFAWQRSTDLTITTTGNAHAAAGSPLIAADAADDPSTLTIHQKSGAPLYIVGPYADLLPILSGPVTSLSFDRLASAAADPVPLFESSISSGSLKFLEVGQSIPLARYDHLLLDKFVGTAGIVQTKACVKVALAGRAAGVKAGRFEGKDRMPTLLAYLFRPDGLPFFVTAFGALWGILWGVVRWLRRKPAA